MNNILILSVFILAGMINWTTQVHAFILQDSIEFSYPHPSPYPYVLSPAINILPHGYITINVGNETYYYCNGIFYQKSMREQKYVVVPPPIGGVVFTIPEGYQLMLMDGISYYEYKGVYYKRTLEGYRVIYPPV